MLFFLRVVGVLTVFLTIIHPALAQSNSTTASHSASCKILTDAPSAADAAYWRGDYKNAASLYADAFSKDPKDSRSRQNQIDSLIAQNKIEDASNLADAWTSSEPANPRAILAASDVRFAEGDWLESYALSLKSQKLDPCMPEVYEAMAQYESLAGYRATARKHILLAHQLAPNDRVFRLEWINSLQNHDQRVAEYTSYLNDSKTIDEKRKRTLLDQATKWSAESENRCELVSSTGPATFPMTAIPGAFGIDSWGIEVALNGKKKILQIDTGASGLFLTKAATTGTGLTSVEVLRIGGFGDDAANSATRYRAASVHIAGLEFKNCYVDGLANFGVMGGGNEMGQRLDDGDGLIGADVFSRYLVTLDYIKHEVRLEPLPPLPNAGPATSLDPLGGRNDANWMAVDRYVAPQMQNWTKIYRRDHMLIIPTRISEANNKLFVADTGAESNLVDVKIAHEFTTSKEDILEFRGLSGTTKKSFQTGSFTLDFAGVRLPVKSMSAIDLSRFHGISGFIGYPTLQQLVMHIDYRDNLVLFEAPNSKKN